MATSKTYPRGILRDPNASLVERVLSLLFRREEIPSRSDPDSLYLRRFHLWRHRDGRRKYLHVFYRSDEDPDAHCHPWRFTTTVLRGGYEDETWCVGYQNGAYRRHVERVDVVRPGMTMRRPATHAHRVRLLDPTRRTWTYVRTGLKERTWYFYPPTGPVLWTDYVGPGRRS